MTSDRPADHLVSLANELRVLPRETECVEFKLNDADPEAGTQARSYVPFWAAPGQPREEIA